MQYTINVKNVIQTLHNEKWAQVNKITTLGRANIIVMRVCV